ncbi:MAG: ATP-binding protein [Candidatus Gracilibacteria bacterium]|nr:ATP-binding protein [Candidatus Gracilibacteria bacterium]
MHTVKVCYTDDISNKIEEIKSCMTHKGLDIEFSYASDFRNAKVLRDFVEIILRLYKVDSREIPRFILITDELNNNAIEHGSLSNDVNYMRIFIHKGKKKIEISIEVEDSGKGKSSKNAKEMNQHKKNRLKDGFHHHKSIRGRGLFLIIINIVNDLYFSDGKKGGLIVGIKKNLHYL